MIDLTITTEDFDPFAHLAQWHGQHQPQGGICHFIGTMRGFNQQGEQLESMWLEHYSGMCEKILTQITERACAQFSLTDILLIHRAGLIMPKQAIVLVAASAPHRGEAFSGCQFIADWLKVKAPFWKEERLTNGESYWVEAKHCDVEKQLQWDV